MSDDNELALQYRMIELWERTYTAHVNARHDSSKEAIEAADKAVQACKKAVGLR